MSAPGGARAGRGAAQRRRSAPPSAAGAARRPGRGDAVPDPARIADGWTLRFVADRARADEVIRLYRELGFEVVADPMRPKNVSPRCGDCRLVTALQFQMIYTRRPRAAAARAKQGKEEADA
jgi:hypothetical protein